MTEAELLAEEVARLKRWGADLQSGLYVNCVYCGHRYGPGETTPVTMADALKAHVAQCPAHPMSALVKEIAASWQTLEGFGFPPETVGWPMVDVAGKLPEAIDCALACLLRHREDLSREVVELRPFRESQGDLIEALTAASHALKSYAYGNAVPDLAKSVAEAADAALAKVRPR